MVSFLPLPRTLLLLLLVAHSQAAGQQRIITSVLPALDYGPPCWSTVNFSNLSDRAVTVDVEAHRAGGGLVGLAGLNEMVLHLNAGEQISERLDINDESGQGWLKVRESVPSPDLEAAIAVSGASECTVANQLRSTPRQLSYPTRNPWFSGDVTDLHGRVISIVNTSDRAAQASLCYSAGNLYSVPVAAHPKPELTMLCSNEFQVLILPYASRQFPVERDNSTYFSIKTRGDAIVLQMLEPIESGVKIYKVDSNITFGAEVTSGK